MDDTAPRLDIPDLEWCHPDCPMCHRETSGDGTSLWCEHCGITWNDDGTGGTRE